MRDSYWNMLQLVTYNHIYWQLYRNRISGFEIFIRASCAVLSCASIAAWSIWSFLPQLWAILLGISQIAQVVYPYLPYENRLAALKFLLPDVADLEKRVSAKWRELENSKDTTDTDYQSALVGFEDEFLNLQQKYLGDDDIPLRNRLESAAWLSCKRQLYLNFYPERSVKHARKKRV